MRLAAWPRTGTGKLSTAADDLKKGAALLPPDKARIVNELLLPFKIIEKQLSTYGETLAEHMSAPHRPHPRQASTSPAPSPAG